MIHWLEPRRVRFLHIDFEYFKSNVVFLNKIIPTHKRESWNKSTK